MRGPPRDATGALGENLVAAQLERQGFVVVARNVRVGRLEIDVIARRGDLLVICEVRTRRSSAFLHPAETIDRAKSTRIRKAAAAWLAQNPQRSTQIRFDAAAVILDPDPAPPRIDYFEAAF